MECAEDLKTWYQGGDEGAVVMIEAELRMVESEASNVLNLPGYSVVQRAEATQRAKAQALWLATDTDTAARSSLEESRTQRASSLSLAA